MLVNDADETFEVAEPRLSVTSFGWWLLICGLIGFTGSLALTLERFWTLIDPEHDPSCNFSVFVTCGPAMESAQGSVLGFPNPVIGVAAFPVVVTIGVLLLLTRANLPAWFWRVFLGGASLGMALIVFLVHTSLYVLRALCPFCMVVWAAMIPLFVMSVAFARQEGALGASGGPRSWLVRNRSVVLIGAFVVLIAWVFLVLGSAILNSL